MGDTAKAICTAVASIVTALVVGEVIGSAVSRPIAAWRRKGVNVERIVMMVDVMDKRISDLEEKKETEAE